MIKAIVLLFCLSLTGCAMQQQFDCPYKEGARCLSVGEIDQKINTGQLNLSQSKDASHDKKLEVASNSEISPSSLRTPETVLMTWIAPYYTTDGVYHEGHRIHFVGSASTWINAPLAVSTAGDNL